jgi:hypothetical protein
MTTTSPSSYLTNPPLTTREREVLKVAKEGLADSVDSYTYTGAALAARQSLRDIIRILENGDS